MRRSIIIACLIFAGVGLLLAGPASGGDGGPYLVRAIFDNGAFIVPGENVRVAGANVGSVKSVGISEPGNVVTGGGKAIPGKAVVTLEITDPAFQDFRQDASCLIRPQSLLGEKYVECNPTQQHAPGSNPSPPLKTIQSGQAGAGERLLPLENNGKAVDIDLVNNIQRQPYAERFRLILNDLGAGLAARGKDLDAIVRRADPALQQTDRVLHILAGENRTLAQLAKDSDTDLAPLARERAHIQGFINNANQAGQATAEKRAALEAGIHRLPETLRQLRPTMVQLKNLADQATPVVGDFGSVAPSINKATIKLAPFARAATKSLKSLGNATEQSATPLKNSDPVIRQTRDLAKSAKGGAKELGKVLVSFKETKGFERLMDFFFYATAATNQFDSFGNLLRADLVKSNCNDYTTAPTAGCSANWVHKIASSAAAALKIPATPPPKKPVKTKKPKKLPTQKPGESRPQEQGPPLPTSPTIPGSPNPPGGGTPDAGTRRTAPLFNFLLGNR